MARAAGRRRKISVTVDPQLLRAVDAYVEQHDELDRSRVIDDALAHWYALRQEEAMVEQFSSAPDPEERAEGEDWRRIRQEAATRLLKRTGD
jgi:hypothetical protein